VSLEKSSTFLVYFNGRNYLVWAVHFMIFVKGKDLWGQVNGRSLAPDKNNDKEQHTKWEVNDAPLMA
jgi:hypothetical protein